MELVGDSAFCGEFDHIVHHVSRSGHHETYVLVFLKHFRSGLDEILGSFLHRDSSEEGDHLLASRATWKFEQFLIQRDDGVVDRCHLVGVDAILLDDGPACEVRNADDMVRVLHTVFLDGEDGRVDVSA